MTGIHLELPQERKKHGPEIDRPPSSPGALVCDIDSTSSSADASLTTSQDSLLLRSISPEPSTTPVRSTNSTLSHTSNPPKPAHVLFRRPVFIAITLSMILGLALVACFLAYISCGNWLYTSTVGWMDNRLRFTTSFVVLNNTHANNVNFVPKENAGVGGVNEWSPDTHILLGGGYRIDSALIRGTANIRAGKRFTFTILNTRQRNETEDALYVKVVSRNTRQVADIEIGPLTSCRAVGTDSVENDPLVTPLNPSAGEVPGGFSSGPSGNNGAETVRCNRYYNVSFTAVESGKHIIVIRVYMKNIPLLLFQAPCPKGDVCRTINVPSYYRAVDDMTLTAFQVRVYGLSPPLDPNRANELPPCNYTGMSNGVWLTKRRLFAATGALHDAGVKGSGHEYNTSFWNDRYVWVPSPGALCKHTGRNPRQPDQKTALKMFEERKIKRVLYIGDSITREMFFDTAEFFQPNGSHFVWEGTKRSDAVNDLGQITAGAPTISYWYTGYLSRPHDNMTLDNFTCWGNDMIVLGHGLWTADRYQFNLIWTKTYERFIKYLVAACSNVINNGNAYYLAMPSVPRTKFLRMPARIKGVNEFMTRNMTGLGFRVLDPYHWSDARPEGTKDGTHYGQWSNSTMFLSRNTIDLWLSDLAMRQ